MAQHLTDRLPTPRRGRASSVASVCLSRCGPTCGTPACRQSRCTTSPTRSARTGRSRRAQRQEHVPRLVPAANRQIAPSSASPTSSRIGSRSSRRALPRTSNCTGPPIDVARAQSRAISIRPQPEPGEEHHHRQIAARRQGQPIAPPQAAAQYQPAASWRDQGLPPSSDLRGRLRHRPARAPMDVQEPQQRPQLGDLSLRCPDAHPPALTHQELATPAPSGRRPRARPPARHGGQEPACERLIAQHRHRRQPTLHDQPLPIFVDQQPQPAKSPAAPAASRRPPADMHQQQLATPGRTGPIPASSPPPRTTRHRHSQAADRDILRCHPPAQPAQILEHHPDRLRRVAQLQQPHAIPVHERPSRPSCLR